MPTLLFRAVLVPAFALGGLVFVLTRPGCGYCHLAGLLTVFVLAVDLVTFTKGRLQNALVFAASIIFFLLLLESFGQMALPRTSFEHPDGLFGDRAELGWGPTRPGTYSAVKAINGVQVYSARYTIDDDLLRHVRSNVTGPLVAFFGDSFTFGDGINDEDTLPQQFADMLPCFHVLNLAFSAYSPSQMLRELEAGLFDARLRSPRLFVLQTGPFHVERTACKTDFSIRGPRYVTVGRQLEYKAACTSGLWRRVKEFTSATAIDRLFVSPIARRPTHDDVVNYLNIMAAIAKLSRQKYHVPLIVLYVRPEPALLDGTGFSDSEIFETLKKLGIHVIDTDVDAEPDDVLRIPGEGHPTRALNRLIASKLVGDLKHAMPDVLQACPTH